MTQLALAVDADDELWTLDDLPTPEAPYVEVGDELVEVRSRFPSSYYTLTGETLPPRIRVRRGIAGTTAASHIQGSTLTPNYGLGSGAGGGAIAVDNTVEEPVDVTGIVAVGASFDGTVATLRGKDFYAQDDDPGAVGAGSRWIETTSPPYLWWERNAANDGWDANANPIVEAVADADANAASQATTSGAGAAVANAGATATGDGNALAGPAANTDGAGNASAAPSAVTTGGGNAVAGSTATATGSGAANAGPTATTYHVNGIADVIATAIAVAGTAKSGIKAIRGATEIEFRVEVDAQGVAKLYALGLPTADPEEAGVAWLNNGVFTVSAG